MLLVGYCFGIPVGTTAFESAGTFGAANDIPISSQVRFPARKFASAVACFGAQIPRPAPRVECAKRETAGLSRAADGG